MQKPTDVYPFNLASDLFSDSEDVVTVYVPGVSAALDTLTEREADILLKRYRDKITLEAAGNIHGVGKERIRQIEAMALRKLRHPSRKNMMRAVPLSALLEQNAKYEKLNREYKLLASAFEELSASQAAPETMAQLAGLAATMLMPLEELDLSTRSYRCLKRAGKNILRDIAGMTENDLLEIRNLGRKSALEVVECLKKYGVQASRP